MFKCKIYENISKESMYFETGYMHFLHVYGV